jgi:transketolase
VLGAAEGAARGAYVLAEASSGTPEVLLMATGSEVALALEARAILEEQGIATRVVSMPCLELFAAQDPAYREEVLPSAVRARVAVELGSALGWASYVGDTGEILAMDTFGASAPAGDLATHFGFTTEALVAAARRTRAAQPA